MGALAAGAAIGLGNVISLKVQKNFALGMPGTAFGV
jgi:hypothetical protein